MADQVDASSELSKIAKLNGDFKRSYGSLLGASLYLRSVRAARGGTFGSSLIVALFTAAFTWWRP